MRNIIYNKVNTIKFKLLAGICIFLLPVLIALIYSNFYVSERMLYKIAVTNKNANELYLSQVDTELVNAEYYLVSLMANDINFSNFEKSTDRDRMLVHSVGMGDKLRKDVLLYSRIDVYYVYIPSEDILIYGSNGKINGTEIGNVNNEIKQICAERSGTDEKYNWSPVQIHDEWYLNCSFEKNEIYAGAWVKASSLIETENQEDAFRIFISNRNQPLTDNPLLACPGLELKGDFDTYYLTGEKEEYLVTGNASERCEMVFLTVDTVKNLLGGYSYLKQLLLIFFIGIISVIILYTMIIRRVVLRPLMGLMDSINRVRGGDMNSRVALNNTTVEFSTLSHIFNDMVDNIESLKIQVYEEKLGQQQEELEKLQLQVHPHFYLNSLGIIFNLAKIQDYERLQLMTKSLIEYFRFIFRSSEKYVLLRDEIENVENYLKIQEIRYPEMVCADIRVDQQLQDLKVPPLLVYTFVENSIKYAIDCEKMIVIEIECKVVEVNTENFLFVQVSDNGRGYDREILHRLNAGMEIVDSERAHIGIFNLRRRISILYHGSVTMEFKNRPQGGAVVELLLPLYEEEKERCEEIEDFADR